MKNIEPLIQSNLSRYNSAWVDFGKLRYLMYAIYGLFTTLCFVMCVAMFFPLFYSLIILIFGFKVSAFPHALFFAFMALNYNRVYILIRPGRYYIKFLKTFYSDLLFEEQHQWDKKCVRYATGLNLYALPFKKSKRLQLVKEIDEMPYLPVKGVDLKTIPRFFLYFLKRTSFEILWVIVLLLLYKSYLLAYLISL